MHCYSSNLQWSSSSWCFPSFLSNLFKLASSVSLGNNFWASGIFWACFLSPSLNVLVTVSPHPSSLCHLQFVDLLSEFLCGYSSSVKSPTILHSSSVCIHFLPLVTSLGFQCISFNSVSYMSGLIAGDYISTWWHNFVFWVFSSLILLINYDHYDYNYDVGFYCWWALSRYFYGITYHNWKFCFWLTMDSSEPAIFYIRSRFFVQIHYAFTYIELYLLFLLCSHSAAICSYLSALKPLNSFM